VKKKTPSKVAKKTKKHPVLKKTTRGKPKKPAKSKTSKKLKILFVTPECAPFAKVGGLGDVVGALPKVLKRMGHDAQIIMPLYASIDRQKYGIEFERSACVHMGGGEEQWIGIYHATLDGEVPVWFVEYDRFFGRPGVYDEPSGEYKDNAFRYALLSKAALQVCKDVGFIPDVMHVHDWPTALVSVFLKTWDRVLSPLSGTASVLTIHNIGYQGVYHASAYPYIGVGYEHFTPNKFEDHGNINLLKAGIAFSDALTTVSPTHAKEILDPAGGMGLAPFLNARGGDLVGILNGADYDHWNPSKDKFIAARYSPRNMKGKLTCKADLQRRFQLQEREDVPVFGIVSRLAHQKGFGLLIESLPSVLDNMDCQIVVLGTGDSGIEHFIHWLISAYPGRAGGYVGFSVELSHVIEAGSDFFLMPSLYEPCGLNQIYSMKYGTLPVVRAIGGLDDTVQNYNEATGEGTGFKFFASTAGALYDTIGWAVSTWYDRPRHIEQMRKSAMAQDFSWRKSAEAYVKVYERAIKARRTMQG